MKKLFFILMIFSGSCTVAMQEQYEEAQILPALHVQFLEAVGTAAETGDISLVQNFLPTIDRQDPLWERTSKEALETALSRDSKELLELLLNNNFLPEPSPELVMEDWSEKLLHLLLRAVSAKTTNSLETLIAYAKIGKIPPLDCSHIKLPANPFENSMAYVALNIIICAIDSDRWEHLFLLCNHTKLIPLTCLTQMARKHCTSELRQKIVFKLVEQGALVDFMSGPLPEGTPLSVVFKRGNGAQREQRGMAPLLLAFGATNREGAWAPEGDLTPNDMLSLAVWSIALSGTLSDQAASLLQIDLMRGASFEAHDRCSSLTPTMILASRGRTNLLKQFFQLYPATLDCINSRACNDWNALSFAAYGGHAETVRFLLTLSQLEKTRPLTKSGLSPYKLALIGAHAREMAENMDGNASLKESQTVITVLDEFNRRRMATLLSMFFLMKELNIPLPMEIIENIVNAYRFNDDAK